MSTLDEDNTYLNTVIDRLSQELRLARAGAHQRIKELEAQIERLRDVAYG